MVVSNRHQCGLIYRTGIYQVALQQFRMHSDALVDDQTLDLMEDGGVGGIHLVSAVHTTGAEDADGRLAILHGASLCGRGLGAKQ